jgi:hypothetical protein
MSPGSWCSTWERVAVDLHEIKGGVPGFDLLAANSSVSQEAMQRRIQFLRRVFEP